MEDNISAYVRKNSILENNFVWADDEDNNENNEGGDGNDEDGGNGEKLGEINKSSDASSVNAISMASLTESLTTMKSACIEVEDKQRRRGGSLLGPEPIKAKSPSPIGRRQRADNSNNITNINSNGNSDSNSKSSSNKGNVPESSPIHSPGPRFYNNNSNDEFIVSAKGREVPTEFKNAIDSVLTQFNVQFSAIEQQMQTLNSNMQQMQSEKER